MLNRCLYVCVVFVVVFFVWSCVFAGVSWIAVRLRVVPLVLFISCSVCRLFVDDLYVLCVSCALCVRC